MKSYAEALTPSAMVFGGETFRRGPHHEISALMRRERDRRSFSPHTHPGKACGHSKRVAIYKPEGTSLEPESAAPRS